MKHEVGTTPALTIAGGLTRVFTVTIEDDWLISGALMTCVVLREFRQIGKDRSEVPTFIRAFSPEEAGKLAKLLETASNSAEDEVTGVVVKIR